MKAIYLDCSAGAAGDMITAALLDCGLSLEKWQAQLRLLPLDGYQLFTQKTLKKGIHSLQVKVKVEKDQPPRHLPEIEAILHRARLSSFVREKSLRVFQLLGRVEARVHGVELEKVHFHEVGAVDSILDIVGSMLALEMLNAERVTASPLPLGRGWVHTGHGQIPLPAPATAEIIKDLSIPCYGVPVESETVTPTGAAILGTICSEFTAFPPLYIEEIGYGAGERDHDYPNILRAFWGRSPAPQSQKEENAPSNMVEEEGRLLAEPLEILEANIDDLNPEIYDYVLSRLFDEGALDAYLTPIQMKKNRPAVKLTVLASPRNLHRLGRLLLRETTTLGYRRWGAEKYMLPRTRFSVETPWGPVNIKAAGDPPHYQNISPEYEDCLKIAREQGIPLKKVYQAVWNRLKQ